MRQALEGIRVVELSAGMAGPWIGRIMAYAGAEVIRVESRAHPDVVRQYIAPKEVEKGIQPQLSPWFTDWNAGKRFVALDLGKPGGSDLCKRLVAISDLVVENLSAGVLDRLGLGYEALRRVKDDIILFRTTGYGENGPCRGYVTWGPNIEALSGLSTLSGFPGRACTLTQYAYPDALSALHGLFAVLCALEYRRRTGKGQQIDLSQLEATVAVLGPLFLDYFATGREPAKLGNRSRRAAPHGCYPCKGVDRWCAIAVSSDEEWRRFCRVVNEAWTAKAGFATLCSRLQHADELDRFVAAWTAEQDAYAVMRALQAAGLAAGVVQNVEDLLRHDPQLSARGMFEEVEHLKKGRVVATGIPLGLTGTPGRTGMAGKAMGADNDYVFAQLLGMTRREIQGYIDSGAIEP